MFLLTEQTINSAINTISGYIVSIIVAETGKSIEEITEAFLASETYALLSDSKTGYYWDSMSELIDLFEKEMNCLISNDTEQLIQPEIRT